MSPGARGEAGEVPTLSRTSFAAIFTVMLTSAVGNTGLLSIMPAIGRQIGIADYLVASIFSLSALLWAIASPYWARVADRRGRKPLILLGMVGFIMSMLGCGLIVLAGLKALLAPAIVFAAFLVMRSSYGLLGSASATAGQAYVADRSFGGRRVKLLSLLAGAINLGSILGPAMAPFFIIGAMGLAGPMFIFGAAAVFVLLSAAAVIPRDRPLRATDAPGGADGRPPVAISSIWREPAVRPFLIYGMLVSSMQAINTYTLGFLVIDRLGLEPVAAQAYIGKAMVAGAVAGLIAQWGLVGTMGMRPQAMLRWGALLPMIGNVLIVADTSFTVLLIAFAIANLGYGLARPGFVAGASLRTNQARQGAVAGAVTSIAGASIVLPPVLAIALYQIAPSAPFLIIAAVQAMLLTYTLMRADFRNILPAR